MMLYDGKNYKAVPTELCDELEAWLAAGGQQRTRELDEATRDRDNWRALADELGPDLDKAEQRLVDLRTRLQGLEQFHMVAFDKITAVRDALPHEQTCGQLTTADDLWVKWADLQQVLTDPQELV